MSRDDGAPVAAGGAGPGGGEASPASSSMGIGLARVRVTVEARIGKFSADWAYGCLVYFNYDRLDCSLDHS